MCTRVTPPEICSAGRTSRPLIGRRASGGGVWIAYIKQAQGASQLVVAASVTLFCVAVGTSLGLLVFLRSGQLVALTGSYRLDFRCCCN